MSDFQESILATPSHRNVSELASVSRRKALGALGLTASGICLSTGSASAGWFGKKKEDELPIVKVKSSSSRQSRSKNVTGLPDEWLRMHGRKANSYAKYINSLKLKNISAHDVISAHAKQRGDCWNQLPPKKWWSRMGYTLKVVDRISQIIDAPVKEIVSAYRCPHYNARCAGAKKRSWHQANVAVDVKFEASPRYVTQVARSVRDRGLFKGGVGGYSSFTHIDTRGVNVNW